LERNWHGAGGEAIGVIPEHLMAREIGHNGLTKLHVVRSMHERKALMADLSDAFVALPGGFGTLEEFCEVVTWTQLGLHSKSCGILNVVGYYSPLLAMLEHAGGTRYEFVPKAYHCRDVYVPPDLLEKLQMSRTCSLVSSIVAKYRSVVSRLL
jgi:uncharacterized protein (TIGR00730 family)